MHKSKRTKAGLKAGLATGLLATLPLIATAQDRPNTILVLDGSGSMWGQIDGVNKITIAQQVVGEVLDGFPADQNLGLTVYGHREKGNCADIETVVPPGPGTGAAIRAAVDGIKPKGKTPMTDAVIAAATALRYTEEKATVILVSDGIETCNPDPCAAAAALEEAGVDFTAHVVGFDVSDPQALAQMQCMAEGTGGRFLSASDAAELSQALTTVAAAVPEPEPEPEPKPVTVTLEARLDAADGPLVEGPVLWTIEPAPENMSPETEGNGLDIQMLPGAYTLTADWIQGEATARAPFDVGNAAHTVTVLFDSPAQSATVTAPQTAVAGSTIEVAWQGPDEEDDYIGIGPEGATGAAQWTNFTRTSEGATLRLLVPADPGRYAVQYFLGRNDTPIGGTVIEVTAPQNTLTAPASAPGGSQIEVAWTGPGYEDDFIAIGKADATGSGRWESYTRTSAGNPVELTVPVAPGDYVITYFVAQDNTPLTSVPLTVTALEVGVTAPASAVAGSTIQVNWTGPGYEDDFIGIGPVGATGGQQWQTYSYTRDGNPVALLLPTKAGEYTISYFAGLDNSPLGSTSISLNPVTATLTAPASAPAGGTIAVEWTGPDYDSDFIGIGPVGATGGGQWQSYAYTADGSTLQIPVPEAPGPYVIRYFLAQDQSAIAETQFQAE